MQIIKNCVLLLKAEKSEDAEDKFEVILSKNGFTVKHLKTLEFVFKNLEELKIKLEDPRLYEGIIFTTPRSVRAARECLDNTCIKSEWKEKSNYVVGETTHDSALRELGLNCKGQDSGNASNLADFILNSKSDISKPFLFPCGNLKTDTLVNRLTNKDIAVETITVYETIGSRTLREDFSNVTSNFKYIPEYFVYFSPSGVYNTVQYIECFKDIKDDVKFIAIGPTTEAALKSSNITVHSVAPKPTPSDLLTVII